MERQPYLLEPMRAWRVLEHKVLAPRVAELLALRVPALDPPQPDHTTHKKVIRPDNN
jgi:hypothetical protein